MGPETLDNSTPLVADTTPVAPQVTEKPTRKRLGQLRRQYLTVNYGVVKACGHKAAFSKDHDPRNNCVDCWAAYLMTCVDLDQVHVVLTTQGVKALTAKYGTRFVKMFHGFLSSKLMPMLEAQVNNQELPAQVVGGTFGNDTAGNEVQADSSAQ